MHVLQIANAYVRNKLYTLLFDALDQNQVQQTVFVPVSVREPIPAAPDNVHIVKCFRQIDRLLFYSKQKHMLQWMEENLDMKSFDVIHAHTVFSGGYAAMQLSKRYGIPYVVAVRSTDVNEFFRYMVHLRQVGVEVLKNASKIIFLSPSYARDVLERYVPANCREEIRQKSCVIPNGIDRLFLENKAQPRSMDPERIRLVYTGDFTSIKNPELTIQAARILRSQGRNVTMTAIGRIKEKKYERILKDAEFVTHHGFCSQQQLMEYWKQSDIFVMPSHTETFGLVYAEAMSQGLPVLYTAGQGFDGHFPDGTVGYAVSDTDAELLAQKILAVIDRYEEFSRNGIALVDRGDWREIAKQYANIYQEIRA